MTLYYSVIQRDLHHSYIKRTICRDQSKDFPQHYNQYKLLSLAKNDIIGIDIFLLYFPSLFKSNSGLNIRTKINQLKGVKYEHFSYFFMVFVEIYALKYIIFSQDQLRTDIMKSVVGELIDQRTYVRNQVSFAKELKNLVTEILQKPAYSQWMKRQNSFKHVLEIQNRIADILTSFNRCIDDEYFMQKLRDSQVFFDSWNENHENIKIAMANISKIKCLNYKSKKITWFNFYQDNKNFMKMQVPLIDGMKQDINFNKIIVKRYSGEKDYIYIKFFDYIKNIHEVIGLQKEKYNPILKKNIGSLLKISKQYHSKTKQYFPKLSINDIFINQHTLELFFAHHNLMLSYLGLDQSIKTAELRIVSQPTPKGIDNQVSYFEVDPQNEIKMRKKYYFYDTNTFKKKKQQQISYVQNDKLFENIHVWRLLNIIRFMELGSFMGQDYYSRKLCRKRPKMKDITRQKYYQELKYLKQDLQQGTIKQQFLLPILKTYDYDNNSKKNSTSSPQQKRHYFEFTFKELEQEFDYEDGDDSLLCDNLLRIKMVFYHRAVILRQLNTRFNEKELFKSIPNPLKYQFIYCMNAFERATKQLQFLQRQRKKRRSDTEYKNPSKNENIKHKIDQRELLQMQFNQQIDGINLSRQFISRTKINKTIISKLDQYLSRQPAERNRKYVQNDKNQINSKIKEIEQYNKDFVFLDKCRRILWQQDILPSRRLRRAKEVIRQAESNYYSQRFLCISKIMRVDEKNQRILDKMLSSFGDQFFEKCEEFMVAIRKIIITSGVIKAMEKFVERQQKLYNLQLVDSLEKMYKCHMVGLIIKLYFMLQKYDFVLQTMLSSVINQISEIPQDTEEKMKWFNERIQEFKQKMKLLQNQQTSRIPYNVEQAQGYNFETEQQFFNQFYRRDQSNFFQTMQQSQQLEHNSKN